jgi:hypothetical protein
MAYNRGRVSGFIGFAVGRTDFWEPLVNYRAGIRTREAAVAEMARRYRRAIAVANATAFVSEAIHPISIFISLTRRNLMTQTVPYILFGEGDTGLMVYTVLLSYWDWTPQEDVRPVIFLMSD